MNYDTRTGQEIELDKKLTAKLEQILEDQVGKIPEAEKDLIIGIAKEMIAKDKEQFPDGFVTASKLEFQDVRQKLFAALIAATAEALYIERHIFCVEQCQQTFKNYLTLSKDPKATPEALKELKEELKRNLHELNKLEPNPQNRLENEKIINDDQLIEKITQTKEQIKEKKGRDQTRAERNEPKTEAHSQDDKKLE